MDWKPAIAFVTVIGVAVGYLSSEMGNPYLMFGYWLGLIVGIFTVIAIMNEQEKKRMRELKRY